MLIMFSQFLLKECVRSPVYLLNPPLTKSDEVSIPRLSVLHYLDFKYDTHFPNRKMSYFSKISDNKKIPITHIHQLIDIEGTSSLRNKNVKQEIRDWNRLNIKSFRDIDILSIPNNDVNLVSVVNYNLLKDLYNYKISLTTNYTKYINISKTYWSNVKKAIELNVTAYHIIPIEIPIAVPNYNMLNTINKFSVTRFSRVITDINLLQVIDIFNWLITSNRHKSSLQDISDKDSSNIIIEFKYKGYSTFMPLYILRGLGKDSELDSKSKISDDKVQKLFIMFLYKCQNKVNEILEQDDVPEQLIDTNPSDIYNDDSDNDDVVDSFTKPSNIRYLDKKISRSPLKLIDKTNEELLDINGISDTNLDKLIDLNMSDLDDSSSNELFEEAINSVIQHDTKPIKETDQVSVVPVYTQDEITNTMFDKTSSQVFDNYISNLTTFKLASAPEIRALKKVIEERKELKSPYDKNIPINNYQSISSDDKHITDKDKFIPIINDLVSDDLKSETIQSFDTKYLKYTLKKDIVACVTNLEKAGIIVKNYAIEEDRSALGNYEIHSVTLKPLDAKETTVYFRLPIIDAEGEFVASNIKFRMRKQKTDLPIRKISPTRVALTSNYSKLFLFRTDRKAFDSYSYLISYIKNEYVNNNSNILKLIPGNTYDNNIKHPNVYSVLSQNFALVQTKLYTFMLGVSAADGVLDKEVANEITSKNLLFIGYTTNKDILVMNNDSLIFNYTKSQELLGDMYDLLEIDTNKIPSQFSMIKVLGDDIPLGVVLSYYIGLDKLLAVTNSQYKLIEASKQYRLTKKEVLIKFLDYKLVIENVTEENKLLFNGFLFFKEFTKRYNLVDFYNKNIYLNMFELRNFNLIHIKELDLLQQLFLDPITIDVLKDMGEPVEYLPLLIRANELLKDLSHPDINDTRYSRIRGYDRIPGLMYRALSESVRKYKFKNSSRGKIELDPYKVWNYITQDNTVKISEDSNPILDLKEMETVTFTGMDGLNKDATPKNLRNYHRNDIGTISEGTVDSSDVALNIYLAPYANFKTSRGLIGDNKETIKNKSKLFSTSVMLAPMSEYDDPKRVNFVQIQNGHTITATGYSQPLLRTGYEYVVPYKVGKLYCSIAKQDGLITSKTDKMLTVTYSDNTVENIPIGTIYGKMEGSIFPHKVVSDLDINTKVKEGDYLAYNSGFFEKDWLDPSRLILKFGRTVTTALMMNNEVYEDSSAICSSLSKEMSTSTITEKSFITDFSMNIINILPEGTTVSPNDILFTLTDENVEYNNLSEKTIEMLQNLSNTSPKAKVNGIIDRYEVYYNGDITDMSPSLKKLVNRLDQVSRDKTKGTQYEIQSNKVTSEYRIEGKNLNIDTLEIKVYIRTELSMGIGDKGVFSNQMKSVISDVFTSDIYTESGQKVEAMFSYKGILGRVVLSPILIGTTNTLLKHVSKQLSDIYFD